MLNETSTNRAHQAPAHAQAYGRRRMDQNEVSVWLRNIVMLLAIALLGYAIYAVNATNRDGDPRMSMVSIGDSDFSRTADAGSYTAEPGSREEAAIQK